MNTKLLIATFAHLPEEIRHARGALAGIAGTEHATIGRDQVSWACVDAGPVPGELALLEHGLLARWADEVRAVYLYSRFAPCPACARELARLPARFAAARFSLAYHVLRPTGGGFDDEAVRAGLRGLAAGGWRVRDGDGPAAVAPQCSLAPSRAPGHGGHEGDAAPLAA